MNAQSNHPSNDITDPQFLGPEAGQQAEGESQRVNEMHANGSELRRYFSVARSALISVRSNGVTLFHQIDDDWKVLSRKKVGIPLAQWVANKKAALIPTGHRVEPDGTGPDGVPSWLRALRLI